MVWPLIALALGVLGLYVLSSKSSKNTPKCPNCGCILWWFFKCLCKFQANIIWIHLNPPKRCRAFYLIFFILLISLQITLFNPDIISQEIARNYLLPVITTFTLIPLTSFAYSKMKHNKDDLDIFISCSLCHSPMEPIGKWKCTKKWVWWDILQWQN